MKNDKTKLIIWATVALVIGVIIGAFLIGPMTITGDAKAIAKNLAINAYTDDEMPLTGTFGCSCNGTPSSCPGYYVNGALNCSCCSANGVDHDAMRRRGYILQK